MASVALFDARAAPGRSRLAELEGLLANLLPSDDTAFGQHAHGDPCARGGEEGVRSEPSRLVDLSLGRLKVGGFGRKVRNRAIPNLSRGFP